MLRRRFVTSVRHFTPLHNPNPISLSETIKWLVVRPVVAARRNFVEVAEVLIEFSSLTFSVVSFSPVISSSGLSEHEVVWSEDLAEGARPHAVHGAGLQVHQHGLEFKIQLKFSSSSSYIMAGIWVVR